MPKTNRKPGIHLHKTNQTYKDMTVEYYWILIAKNGKTIAKSSETYKTKRAAVKSIQVAEVQFLSHTNYYDHTKKDVEQVDY